MAMALPLADDAGTWIGPGTEAKSGLPAERQEEGTCPPAGQKMLRKWVWLVGCFEEEGWWEDRLAENVPQAGVADWH